MSNPLAACYGWFRNAVSSLQSVLLLCMRLYWGWQFMQTGLGKLHRIPGVTSFFTQLGLPLPHATALFVAWLELIGGCLLILGLASRVTACALFIDMLVAYITADRAALLSFFSDPGKFTAAAPYTFLFASLLILIFGPGRFALDTLVAKFWPDRRSI